MSLSLLPITALLLLLSGVGTPAHAAGYKEAIAALRKQLLSTVATPPEAAIHIAARTPRLVWPTAPTRAQQHIDPTRAQLSAPCGQSRTSERKQYRTRFGFAEGAYLAVGPPACTLFAIFG